MPSLVTRGRTFRITPVSMYCTDEKLLSLPRPVLIDVELIGMREPTFSVASALFRTKTEGVCSSRKLVTVSKALMTAAAFLPRNVQPTPPLVTVPAMSPQMLRPAAEEVRHHRPPLQR